MYKLILNLIAKDLWEADVSCTVVIVEALKQNYQILKLKKIFGIIGTAEMNWSWLGYLNSVRTSRK